MSKDYRYQREEWDSVEDGDLHGKKSQDRRHQVKTKQKRDVQRRAGCDPRVSSSCQRLAPMRSVTAQFHAVVFMPMSMCMTMCMMCCTQCVTTYSLTPPICYYDTLNMLL